MVPLTDEGFSLDKFIDHAARSLTRRYQGWVEFEDVRAEIDVYVIKEAKRIQKWTDGEEFFRIRRALIGAGKHYCVNEKIVRSGNVYDYDDLAWYSGAAVARLAPLATDPLFDGQVVNGEQEHSTRRDPKEGGTLIAAVMDVRRGLDKYGPLPGDPESDEYAEHCERIAEFLGGESPESAAPRVGTRKAVSNETARLTLRRQGE